jgi:hypothetical protein
MEVLKHPKREQQPSKVKSPTKCKKMAGYEPANTDRAFEALQDEKSHISPKVIN